MQLLSRMGGLHPHLAYSTAGCICCLPTFSTFQELPKLHFRSKCLRPKERLSGVGSSILLIANHSILLEERRQFSCLLCLGHARTGEWSFFFLHLDLNLLKGYSRAGDRDFILFFHCPVIDLLSILFLQ